MKKWGKISVVGIPTKIVEATPEEIENPDVLGEHEYSSYDPDTSTITLNSSLTEPDMKCFYVVHEALHAGIEHSGLVVALQERFELSDQEASELEEQIVTALTPAVHGAHKDFTKVFARFRRGR